MVFREDEFRCMKCNPNATGVNICLTTVKGRGGERPALRANCPDCNTKMFKFVKVADAQRLANKYGTC